MEIIGLCGKKGSGKSTLSGLLGERYPGAIRIPFGKYLKQALVAMGLPVEIFFDPALKEVPHHLLQGRTPRHAMVTLGTEWGRDMIGPHFWVDLWVNDLNKLPVGSVVIVDDVRFPDEASAVRDLDGFLVNISRGPQPKTSWWERRKVHRSEQLNPEDHEIPTILNVENNVNSMLDEFYRLYDQHRGT